MDREMTAKSIRDEYQERGVDEFYERCGDDYRNPHEDAVRAVLVKCAANWELDLSRVLDLACGSGEATLALQAVGAVHVDGADPYTGAAYRRRTGREALPLSFDDISAGALADGRYSIIVCSYALHLLSPSKLPALLQQLGQHAPALLVLTPHKRPDVSSAWGWELCRETYEQRVRARLYRWLW
jgi:SAM-dependent methyltransferase